MLGAQYTNYIPAALDAGLMPLLVEMMAEPNEDCDTRSAVMRSLRLLTSKAMGARTELESDALHQTVLDACLETVHEWYSRNEPEPVPFVSGAFYKRYGTSAALRAATDALRVAANLWMTGI
jgi:hypothetical protein